MVLREPFYVNVPNYQIEQKINSNFNKINKNFNNIKDFDFDQQTRILNIYKPTNLINMGNFDIKFPSIDLNTNISTNQILNKKYPTYLVDLLSTTLKTSSEITREYGKAVNNLMAKQVKNYYLDDSKRNLNRNIYKEIKYFEEKFKKGKRFTKIDRARVDMINAIKNSQQFVENLKLLSKWTGNAIIISDAYSIINAVYDSVEKNDIRPFLNEVEKQTLSKGAGWAVAAITGFTLTFFGALDLPATVVAIVLGGIISYFVSNYLEENHPLSIELENLFNKLSIQ